MQGLSDEELIARSRELNGSSHDDYLEELFRRHFRRVSLWCMRYSLNREEARDLAQETLSIAFERLSTYRGSSRFSSWLFGICRNHCLNHVRARSARPQSAGDELLAFLPAPGHGSMESGIARRRQLELARGWIRDLLDDTERRVLVMHFIEELPLDQITKSLGLENASGAKAYVVSARRKLSEAARRWKVRNE